MTGPNLTCFHRHGRAVLAAIVTMVVLAGGYALVSAVQGVRTAANRTADL
jgi:hypothetical protein